VREIFDKLVEFIKSSHLHYLIAGTNNKVGQLVAARYLGDLADRHL